MAVLIWEPYQTQHSLVKMPIFIALIILAATFITSFISGIFGMAGGMILMGVLVAVVAVPTAMITHGAIMMVANGWRAYLLKEDIIWPVFWRYIVGAALGIGLLFFIVWRPGKTAIYFILSLIPIIVWIPKRWFHLDIRKPGQAEFTGFIVQAMNTLAGVAGPLLDIFFVRTDMTRQQIVATKSATQSVSHIIKMIFWSAPLIFTAQAGDVALFPPLWLILLAAPTAMGATWTGKQILQRMNDANFQVWVKWLVTVIGIVYFARAMGWA